MALGFIAPFFAASPSFLHALTARITQIKGQVDILRPSLKEEWRRAEQGLALRENDRIRTQKRSLAVVQWDTGERVQILENTQFTIQLQKQEERTYELLQGRIKAFLKFRPERKFQIKTPLAAASVRGTEFLLGYEDGRMLMEVYDGLMGLKTAMGEEILVESGRKLEVFPDRPLQIPELLEGRILGGTRAEYEREVKLGISRDEAQKAAAVETRLAEYQEGKTLIDVHGERVRLEEYIIRPAANQFKLVVLNDRPSRFDYFFFTGTFNKDLPTDLSQALKTIDGKTGSSPEYFLTAYETARSNTVDSITENAADGHLVESTLTEDRVLYHPDTDTFETVESGSKLWQTLFDNYSYKVNGTEKFGWEPRSGVSNITAYDYTQFRTRILGTTVTDLATEQALRPSAVERPSGTGVFHDRVTVRYTGNDTFEQYDFYVIDDNGNVAELADFSGATSGQSYKETLLKWNFEQVITASEFQGRKIDLVVEPKILIKSGLLE